MKIRVFVATACVALSSACIRSTAVSTSAGDILPHHPPNANTLNAGAALDAKFSQALSPSMSHAGDVFKMSVDDPTKTNGQATVVPSGTTLYGHVVDVNVANEPTAGPNIQVAFDSIVTRGAQHILDANITQFDDKTIGVRAVDPAHPTPKATTAASTVIYLGSQKAQIDAGMGVTLRVTSTIMLSPPQ